MVPNFGFMSVSFESLFVCFVETIRNGIVTLHTHHQAEKRQKPGRVRNVFISCIPAGRWQKRSGAQMTKWKGPDVVPPSVVTDLRVFKGQAELLGKCHRHHIDIWVVFLMRPLCLP